MKKRLHDRKRLLQLALSLCLIFVSTYTSWGQTPISMTNGDFSSGSTLSGSSPWTTITGWTITQNGTINAVATGGNAAITAASSGVISNALTLVGTNSINGTSNNNNQAAVCLESDKIDISSYAGSTSAFTFAFNMKLSAAASGASTFNVLIRVYDAIGTDITLTALGTPTKVQGKYNSANYASPFGYKSNSIAASLTGAGAPATISLQVHFGQILKNGTTNLNPTIDDITLSAAGAAASTTLTQPASTALSYEIGNGPSSEQSFQVAGTNLGSNNVTVTPGANIELSTTSGSGFASSAITLTPSSGTVATTTLYARLIANISLGTGGGNAARTVTVAATGTANKTILYTAAVNGINTTASAVSALSYVAGSGPSAEGSFTITTNGLTSDLVVTPGSDLEVSTTSVTGFVSTPITLPSTTTSQVIYSRLKAGLSAGSYSGASTAVVVSSTGFTGVTKQFTGTITDPPTTWDGTNWSNGAPTSSLDAIIDGDFSTTASGITAEFSAKTLTVNATKTFTINTGHNITVAGAVTNNGTFTIENNANLIQVNNASNTGSGTATVKRNSNPLFRSDYTLWSSPVTGQNLLAFSPATTTTRFYNYNTATNLYNAEATPGATPFTVGKGYLIRMPNTDLLADYDAGTAPLVYPGVFTGVPNNGAITVPITAGADGFRYNLVGNPYPSPINIWTLVNENSDNIESTLYFWRKTNGHVGQTSAYCTFIPGVLIGDPGTFASNSNIQSFDPVGVIQTGQGFFVEAKSGASNLTFNNTQRVINTANQFFRTKQVAEPSKIWLNATNAAGNFSQMAVTYFDGATIGVDAFDAKYINDSDYALTSSINGAEYTIQGRPAFDVSDVVALNFKTTVAGNYTIAIDHVEGLFSTGQTVFLKDNLLNSVVDLSAGSYTFASAIGTFNSRFEVVYQSTLAVTNLTFTANSVIAFSANGEIRINSGSTIMELVRVYDLQGRLLVEKNQVNATETKLSTTATNQVLLVEITAANGSKITKKIIQ
jgi:hypothetical protein